MTQIPRPFLVNNTFGYNGSKIQVVVQGYDASTMTMSGTMTATDVGEYCVQIQLKDTTNNTWEDGSTDEVIFYWKIVKIEEDNIMANEKLVTLEQLGTVKNYIDGKDAKALKSFSFSNNVLKLYTTEDASGEPAGEINLPEEMFLDLTETKLEDNFAWSSVAYPGSVNPHLGGKTVLVLAVRGDETVNYSFIALDSIITPYTGGTTNTAAVDVTNGAIKTNVKISDQADNMLEVKADGLYAATVKISEEEGNMLALNEDGLYVAQPDGAVGIVFATNQEVEDLFS